MKGLICIRNKVRLPFLLSCLGLLLSCLLSSLFTSLASATSIGSYSASSMWSNYNNGSGSSSGTFTKLFDGSNDGIFNSASGNISPAETYSSLCFSFPNQLVIDNQTRYYQISFSIAALNSYNTAYSFGLSGDFQQMGSDVGTKNTVTSVGSDTSIWYTSSDPYAVKTYYIEGFVDTSSSTVTSHSICFNGVWLQASANNNASTPWFVTRASISLYESVDQRRNDTLNRIENILKDLKTNASTSGVIDAIRGSQEQAHEDAEKSLEEQKKQTQAIEETKDFVTDTKTPESSDIANDSSLPSVGLLPAGPLDSILTLPLNIANSILQSLGGNCSPIVAPLPYVDQNITFPCMGETIYRGDFAGLEALIGGPIVAVMLFYYFKHLYKKVDRAVSLETTDEDEWGVL